MTRTLIRRILMMPFLVLGIVTVAFMLSQITRGDPLAALIGERQMGNPTIVAAAKAKWGLDRSLPERYAIYLGNLVQGDMGTSFRTRQPVASDLSRRLPATLELVVAAVLIGGVTGVFLGVLAAKYRDTIVDTVVRLLALTGSSVPMFWLGLLVLFIFSVRLGILPGPGRLDTRTAAPEFVTGFFTIDSLLAGQFAKFREALAHLVLPASVLGWTVTGIVARLVRASMIDVMSQDFVLAARAKGAGAWRVLLNHGLRNALIPTLTILGFTFAYLITGAVLTETIFSWPGIGSYAVDAARSLDYPAIIGVTIVGGFAFLIANLLTDIAYAIVDPRVRTGGA
ncbi:ABC transporter permease [Jiella endophytica]|uniref:ABC transporter permease n=1 Tax=Jiella endophytica TaxID=2558362 RepID=A0A4Y8RJK8_9HYPH|nr:ABC transporter permease [Jiella endophytica]TFF23238.1 ABC transporter permease [Jiella endophytica]